MNESQFHAKGSIYAKSRPLYPQSLIDYLTVQVPLTAESVAADIGSGTGIFSLQLQPLVKTVFAVEPNDNMRAQAETAFRAVNNIVSVNGSAENAGLKAGSMDCIFAAQAFHWFDRTAFQNECRRILKPQGKVVLIWNDRDMDAEIIRKNSEINATFCERYTGFSNGMDLRDTQPFDVFYKGAYDVMRFENGMEYDLDTFIGRNLSSSFAPREGEAYYEAYTKALASLFHEFSSDGTVKYPYWTHCYIGSV